MKWNRRGILFVSCVVALSRASLGHSQIVERAKLVASDAAALDQLGYSSAIDGDTAVVGAFRDDNPQNNAGSAYVFVRSGGGWSEQAKLSASDANGNDWFGYGVGISGDTIVVGAPEDDHSMEINPGSAYVFVRSGTSWSQEAKLIASDKKTGDEFGATVAISGDTIVVCAIRDDVPGATDAGSAYVFVRSGTTWSQQAKLIASDAGTGDELALVGLSEDGNTAVLGAFRADNAAGTDAGAAYVFVRSGTSWSEQAMLLPGDLAAGDNFGLWVDVSGDTGLIGSYLDDHAAGVDAGSAYVFVRSGTSWSEQAKLVASDAAAGDQFGWGGEITGDRAVVGAWMADPGGMTDAGSAYVFVRSGTSWSEETMLTPSDAAAGDRFGASVTFAGREAVVGAHLDDNAGGTNAGSAYVFCPALASALPYNGDGINVDVLSANPMVLGGTWTPSVAIGHSHGTSGALILLVRSSTVNGPNGGTRKSGWAMPAGPCFRCGGPRGLRLGEVLIAGPLLATIFGTHDGVTGTFPPQPVPSSLCLMPWAAQALVLGGAGDLSTAVYGVVGE